MHVQSIFRGDHKTFSSYNKLYVAPKMYTQSNFHFSYIYALPAQEQCILPHKYKHM